LRASRLRDADGGRELAVLDGLAARRPRPRGRAPAGLLGDRDAKRQDPANGRRGRFSVTLPTTPADQLIAGYRLRTTSGGKTYTLPLVLRTR
jgi:hypothetical protein